MRRGWGRRRVGRWVDGGIPTRAEGGEHRRAGRRRLISSRRALASERAERRGKWRGDRVRIRIWMRMPRRESSRALEAEQPACARGRGGLVV
nr:unnamed protein product [Digitaria exilis]